MSCFPCFRNKGSSSGQKESSPPPAGQVEDPTEAAKKQKPVATAAPVAPAPTGDANTNAETVTINAKNFTFRDLLTATKNFRQTQMLGDGGFGRVYKGTIQATGQVVAVKQLDRTMQEQKEFLDEVLTLSLLHHENLVDLIGYCGDGDQRLLVYEYMPGGSLDQHLYDFKDDKSPLDWFTRLKIAYGAAQGMEYLHEKANPPVIYRDMKSANVLLDTDFNAKLSDFGMAKLGPNGGDQMAPGSRVMGTYGYSAPEYTRSGQVTLKSDVFSYGVVLLELITGRKAIDTTKPNDEQNLVAWAQPFFRDPKKFPQMADPLLHGRFPERSLNQTVAICAMCLQEEPAARPLISDVVMTLSFLSIPEPITTPAPPESNRSSSSDESTDFSKYLSTRKTRKHIDIGSSSDDD